MDLGVKRPKCKMDLLSYRFYCYFYPFTFINSSILKCYDHKLQWKNQTHLCCKTVKIRRHSEAVYYQTWPASSDLENMSGYCKYYHYLAILFGIWIDRLLFYPPPKKVREKESEQKYFFQEKKEGQCLDHNQMKAHLLFLCLTNGKNKCGSFLPSYKNFFHKMMKICL